MIAHGCEHRPDADTRWVSACTFCATPHCSNAALKRVVCKKSMQNHSVGQAASELQGALADSGEHHRNFLIERGVKAQHWVVACGAVMAKDHFSSPQPAIQVNGICHLRHGDMRQAHDVEQCIKPSTKAERKAAFSEAMHGHGKGRSDQRVTSVVIRCGGCNAEGGADGPCRAAERSCVFGIEPLRNECGSQSKCFCCMALSDQVSWCA
ncbi:unannotated protein [freshwater metagenome]|uniref:Unannotated protein n=1 Tax=freshwater metagenome TaxID=449393 RepID=A0A6J6UP76_9ZZZZ